MKKLISIFTLFTFGYIQNCGGSATITQGFLMSVSSSTSIKASKNPGILAVTLNNLGAGSATDSTTTYTVKSNSRESGTLQITGAITAGGNMPTNTALTVSLASSMGISQGDQNLSTTPISLVTQLPTFLHDTGRITYTFQVTNGWTIVAQTITRTITLTLISGS